MPTPIPFAMTPEAADRIRSRLSEPEAGWQPFLVRAFAYADGLSDVVWYEGEHFHIVYQENRRRAAVSLELFGHRVALERDTLRRLTNRILALHTVPVEEGEAKYVLVSP